MQENGQSGAAAAAEVANANGSMGALVLRGLVFGGALLYVFSKSAKFSLFKPAEEVRELVCLVEVLLYVYVFGGVLLYV